MKLLILLTAACISASANGFSQTVTLSLTNAPLEKAFKEIKKQTSYSFVYIREQLKNSLPVTFHVKDAQLAEVLDICFRDQRLSFVIEDHYIIVQTKETVEETSSPNLSLINIKGRVVNENSEPVEGASVLIKGTTKGTTTDHEGYFKLTGVDENAILIVSGVNIETMELTVEGRSTLLMNVRTKITAQKEVIINAGYYNTTSRLSTGNISRVGAETISKQPVSNPLEALEGRMPGVYIQQTSGVSGSGFNIEIRGLNSLRKFPGQNNGNLPLYIVDGVPFTSSSLDQNTSIANQIAPLVSPLNSINPSDIESIEILKDADATAIYGSRGANGVVLITTKKGKAGKTNVDITVYTGVGKVTRMMDLLNTEQYLEMRREAFANDGTTPQPWDDDLVTWDTTRNTNWQKELIGGMSRILNAQASVSGGDHNTQFLFGGGYFRETTVFPGDFADQKGSAHFNLNHSSENKKFVATVSASYLVDHNNLPQADPTNNALMLVPDAPPIYNPDGSLNWANNTWINPFSSFLQPYKGNTNNLVANAVLSYQLLPGFNIKGSAGYNHIQMQQINFVPISSLSPARRNPTGTANYSNQSISGWIVEPQAEYQKTFGKGKLNVLIGSTFQQNTSQAQSFFARGFTSDALIENPSAASSFLPRVFDYAEYKYSAVFTRINYKLADRYLINFTGRRDGSSRFGPGKQFANFGAVGMGWIFSNELFIKKRFPVLNYGKIRTSYGVTGSDQIGDYGFLDTYIPTQYSYNGTGGLTINQLFNPDYAWETNKKFEAAIELGFLKDKFLFATSYYQNQSSNQLVGYPLPTITGQSSLPFYNFPATVQNTGWEFELRTMNLNNKNFNWSTSFNLTIPRNKLVSYPDIEKSSYANTYEVGQSLYVRQAYHFLNVNSQTGIYQFEDVDKDGQISYPNDLQALNEIAKDYYGGIDNNFSYKNFELSIFIQFVKQSGFNYLYGFQPPGTSNNQPTVVLERWQKPGDGTDVQRFSQAYGTDPIDAYFNVTASDRVITDASFIRLKNLSISYQLSAKSISKLKIQKFRIFIQGQNLFTISNYLGLDPETQSFQNIPPLKILTGGIQITF